MYIYTYLTGVGISAKQFIDEGKLVPDDVMVDLMLNELDKIDNESWLLDG